MAAVIWYRAFIASQNNNSPPRERWRRKIEFILSCIGYCVGFGNVWRFPYVVYRNGGGAFLIPYVIVTVVITLPIIFLECVLGQFSSCNPVSVFNFAPAFRGIGVAVALVSLYISIYYVIFIVYSVVYFIDSFKSDLPWSKCDSDWDADENCFTLNSLNGSKCSRNENNNNSLTNINCSTKELASEQYWKRAILSTHTGDYSIENLGPPHWPLLIILLFTWLALFIFISRGIKSSGKIVYFTAVFPYFVLIGLVGLTITLEGSFDGLAFLLLPTWENLFKVQIWRDAITQSFYSSCVGMGGLILYSSYNEFDNKLRWNVTLILFMDFFASFMAAMSVFSVLGFLSRRLDIPVDRVVAADPGLIFIVIPEAFTALPLPQLCNFLFFLMMFTIGIDSESVLVYVTVVIIYEEITILQKHPRKIRALVCLICCLSSIPCATKGGIYLVNFLDSFAVDVTLMWNALWEVCSVVFIYGITRFVLDIDYMLGYRTNWFWKSCWCVVDPILLSASIFYGLINFPFCNSYSWPICLLGWLVTLSITLQEPFWVLFYCIRYFRKERKWGDAFKPTAKWGPRDAVTKIIYLDWRQRHGTTFGEGTTDALSDLANEIHQNPNADLRSVILSRLRTGRTSVFRRFSTKFHDGQISQTEAMLQNANANANRTPK